MKIKFLVLTTLVSLFILLSIGCTNETLTGKATDLQDLKNLNKLNHTKISTTFTDLIYTEGEYIKLNNTLQFDNTTINISYTEPLSKLGEWQTKKGDSGVYLIEVFNINTSKLIDSFILKIKKE